MGHVSLLSTGTGEEGLVECQACGTLQEVADLQAELASYEDELKSALSPAVTELQKMRHLKLTKLENLLTALRSRLTTPYHWLSLMTLQALVVLCREVDEQRKLERYERSLAMSLQAVYGVDVSAGCARPNGFWAQHRVSAAALGWLAGQA